MLAVVLVSAESLVGAGEEVLEGLEEAGDVVLALSLSVSLVFLVCV